jgi:hypothetical protein
LHTSCKRDNGLVAGFFIAIPVALNLCVDIPTPEYADHPVKAVAAFTPSDSERKRAVAVTREGYQTFGKLCDFFGCCRGFVARLRMFCGTELCPCNQAAKILVTNAVLR